MTKFCEQHLWLVLDLDRNSHPQLFNRISVLKNLTKLTATRLQWSYFLVNLQTAWNTILLTRDPLQVFFSQFCEIFFQSAFSIGHLRVSASVLVLATIFLAPILMNFMCKRMWAKCQLFYFFASLIIKKR